MNKVNSKAFFTVQAWMVTELKLKTIERDCFAIIYGYSMDGESNYHGSLSYLSELTGYSRNSVCTALKSLTEKQLLIKTEYEVAGVKMCRYKVNLEYVSSLYGVQRACTPIQQSCTNNINNKINNNIISKDIISKPSPEPFNFGISEDKPKKKNLYSKCSDEIYAYTNNAELISALHNYLSMRLEMKDKPIYLNQWKGMLNKIDECIEKSDKGISHIDIVNRALEKGWASFYPINNQFTKSNSANKFIHHTQVDYGLNEEDFETATDENGNNMKF